jgi:hypothetical protein
MLAAVLDEEQVAHREHPTLGAVVGTATYTPPPDHPNGHPTSPLVFQLVFGLGVGGTLRVPWRIEQLLPGLEPPEAPPVELTGPGVGVGVAITVVVTGGGLGVEPDPCWSARAMATRPRAVASILIGSAITVTRFFFMVFPAAFFVWCAFQLSSCSRGRRRW